MLKVRISLEYGIPPHMVGRLFTARDIAEITAFWSIRDKAAADAERQARVEARATQERRKAR